MNHEKLTKNSGITKSTRKNIDDAGLEIQSDMEIKQHVDGTVFIPTRLSRKQKKRQSERTIRRQEQRKHQKEERKMERIERLGSGFRNDFRKKLQNNKLDPNADYLYHITTTTNLKGIVEYGGVVGHKGKKFNPTAIPELAELGYLYTVNTDEKRVWNAVSYMQIIREKSDCFGGRDGKNYHVVAVPVSYFDENGLLIEDDVKGEIVAPFHRKVDLMGKVIPLDQIHYMGQFITDGNDYPIFRNELVERLYGISADKVAFTTDDEVMEV